MDASEKRIDAVLQRMRCCIDRKNFTFIDPSTNKERDKNLDFLQTYNVDTKVRLAILKSLTTKNFSEEQYDRVKETYKIDGCDATLAISFHEAENDMQFMF